MLSCVSKTYKTSVHVISEYIFSHFQSCIVFFMCFLLVLIFICVKLGSGLPSGLGLEDGCAVLVELCSFQKIG